MVRLLLVRHGQTAGFPGGSYTELTPVGEAQADALGGWMRDQAIAPDRLFVGPRERQQQTCARMSAGAVWGDATQLDALDEHAGREVFEHALALLAAGDPAVDFLRGWDADERAMLRGFRAVLTAWSEGRLQPACEPWEGVIRRAGDAITTMTAGLDRGTVVAVTSAGWIGAAVGGALGASPRTAMELSYAVFNTSVTELLVRGDRRLLWRFNTTPHGHDSALITAL